MLTDQKLQNLKNTRIVFTLIGCVWGRAGPKVLFFFFLFFLFSKINLNILTFITSITFYYNSNKKITTKQNFHFFIQNFLFFHINQIYYSTVPFYFSREYLQFGCGKKVGIFAHHSHADTSHKEKKKMQKTILHPAAQETHDAEKRIRKKEETHSAERPATKTLRWVSPAVGLRDPRYFFFFQ